MKTDNLIFIRDRPLSLKQRAFLIARRKNVEEWREKRKILQKIQDEEEEENGGFTFCNFNKPVTDLERIVLTKKAFRNLDDIDVELNLSFHGYIRDASIISNCIIGLGSGLSEKCCALFNFTLRQPLLFFQLFFIGKYNF